MSEDEAMHAYQYNASPGVPHFTEIHPGPCAPCRYPDEVDYLPIPGIKPILGLVPLACGCAEQRLTVATMTSPGYPTLWTGAVIIRLWNTTPCRYIPPMRSALLPPILPQALTSSC